MARRSPVDQGGVCEAGEAASGLAMERGGEEVVTLADPPPSRPDMNTERNSQRESKRSSATDLVLASSSLTSAIIASYLRVTVVIQTTKNTKTTAKKRVSASKG